MAKDPAVLFYTSDFLTGCLDLDFDERGQYITLLCLQHQKGHLSEKTIRLSVGNVSDCVLEKFIKDEEGLYFNDRMEEEILKRLSFTESRRSNGKLGGRPKKPSGKPSDKPKGKPRKNLLENENEIDNIIKYLNDKTGKSFKSNSSKNISLIQARLNDGYSEENFKTVIDIKCKSWLNDDNMVQYLRPETLFSNKFEGYLNEVPAPKNEPKKHKVMYLGGGTYHYHTEQEIKEWCDKFQTKVHQKF